MNGSLLHKALVVLCATIAIFGSAIQSQSQVYYVVNGGTGTTPYWGGVNVYNPITDFYWTNRHLFMFRASELLAQGVTPGQITSIGFNVQQNTALFATRRMTIKVGTSTTVTALVPPINNYTGTMTTVYSNTAWNVPIIPFNVSGTWYDIAFQTPVLWDGTSNLIIEMCSYRGGWTGTTPTVQLTNVSPAYGAKLYHWQDNADYCATGNGNGGYSYRPIVRFGILAGIELSFPDDVDPRRILRAGSVYDGSSTAFPKPSLSFRQTTGKQVTLTYRIVGPFPSTNVVYQAQVAGNSTITHMPATSALYQYTFNEAVGSAAGIAGALDLTNVVGGSYRVEATYAITGFSQVWSKNFIVAFPNDVAASFIRSPLAIPKKYPRGVNTPVSLSIQNVGLNNITDVRAVATIRRASDQTIVWEDTKDWSGNLATGNSGTIDFNSFNTLAVGLWDLQICVELLNAIDQQSVNDCLPTANQTHRFQTLYNEEVGAYSVGKPTANGLYYANRPFRPSGNIINGGMLDLTDIPVRMEIFKLPARTKVYSELVLVPDCGAEIPNNITGTEFPPFTPDAAGSYEACLTTEYPGDPNSDNNTICQVFNVIGNLQGTYTIGTQNAGQSRNYVTIQDAVNDLYSKGVSGPVAFELTDVAYSVGDIAQAIPALDLSTTIIGVNATNTITFKPSLERSLSKGSATQASGPVVITLSSGKGVGVFFGQSLIAPNFYAVSAEFAKDPRWNNFSGYIAFDGGAQRSIVLELRATTPHRAPIYLGDGSHHVTIKNCVVRNAIGTTPSYATSLPSIVYGFNLFQYQPDVRVVGATTLTYSAGIVSRQKIPTGQSGNNAERLDTVIGSDNKFVGNEIAGFGYGIVTMGIGMAIKGGENVFKTYYNVGTDISENKIFNVRGAGVFTGYEEGAVVSRNRIFNVGAAATTGTSVSAAGIVAGGVDRYHNIGIVINGNEISGVTGDVWTRGILVEQVQNTFPSVGQTGLNVDFPNKPEAATVMNNVIWGLRRTSTGSGLVGIHAMTQRDNTKTGLTLLTTPAVSHEDYFTRQDRIVNNTIMMENDNVSGTHVVAGIAVQHGGGSTVKGNAIMLQGNSLTTSYGYSALYHQGVQMTDGNDPLALKSDRNAYEIGQGTISRFVEITNKTELISDGAYDEFKTLAQWTAWTRRDVNSVQGLLSAMHVFSGIAPNQNLRIRTNPTPIGSVLNNRGESISGVSKDVDNNQRGASGQLIDIGADEFDGRTYIKDYEAISIIKPSAYRSSTGQSSDAEYIMTKAPVNVVGLVRNSGGQAQINVDVTVRVYRESSASNNAGLTSPLFESGAVINKTVKVSIDAGKEKAVDFALTDFTPLAYQQIAGYTVPTRFGAMAQNVTPLYRIDVTTSYDENNTNNATSKVVRFFVQRAGTQMLISSANAAISLTGATQNQIAGRLNKDSLEVAINRLGFVNVLGAAYLFYDVLDRDAWEPRAVDYTWYRTMFWSGNQDLLSRFERRDLRMYIAAGSSIQKKNLAVGSQEYPRKHIGLNVINDESFVNTVLRVKNQAPGTPVPATTNYSNKRIRGNAIARNSVETVVSTTNLSDANPNPALVKPYSDATTPGLALPAYTYVLGDRTTTDSVGGAASASLVNNVVYMGTDWRHWKNAGAATGVERILRGIIDFFESNGGTVVPVELTRFDAQARGNNVDVSWTTASERNADHFVVERADALAGDATEFTSVGTVSAKGNTTIETDYVHRDVKVPNGKYLYRLTAVDVDGSRDRSGSVEVVIGLENMLSVGTVAPQPAVNETTIDLSMPVAAPVRIDIVNMAGETVAVGFDGELTAGQHNVEIRTASIPSGAYSLVITSTIGNTTRTLIIKR